MNEVLLSEEKNIRDLIYEVIGKQVMLDSDLAILYKVETKALNRQVKRNIERFDENFCFQLTSEEYKNLRCQNGTSSKIGGRRYNPYVFTELGVTMLAGILRSKIAVDANKRIIRAFVSMRHYFNTNLIEQKYINKLVLEDHEKIEEIFSRFDKDDEYLYLPGQIYDSYSKVLDIFKRSKKELIIIDSYADKSLLDIIKDLKVKVIIITKKNNLLKELDIEKYNKQYDNLKVIYNNTFHDRYFIIDKKTIYHCGASLNGIGYKTFSINKVEDEKVKKMLVKYMYSLIK